MYLLSLIISVTMLSDKNSSNQCICLYVILARDEVKQLKKTPLRPCRLMRGAEMLFPLLVCIQNCGCRGHRSTFTPHWHWCGTQRLRPIGANPRPLWRPHYQASINNTQWADSLVSYPLWCTTRKRPWIVSLYSLCRRRHRYSSTTWLPGAGLRWRYTALFSW